MHTVMKFQNELAEKYKYKPLPQEESRIYREMYRLTIPEYFNINGDNKGLYNSSGTLIANGYDRIVIGDYGAFVEFNRNQAIHGAYVIKPGEEYRLDKRYAKTVKYIWLTTKDLSDIKIYHQKHTVSYADYKPDYFYVSVFEVWARSGIRLGLRG